MANNPTGEPEPNNAGGKVSEDELRRLYPNYDATCRNRENTPLLFRYGLMKSIYTGITTWFKTMQGQVKDPSSPTGWRKLSELEDRQRYREEEKHKRNK
jgi:hypothetical protein